MPHQFTVNPDKHVSNNFMKDRGIKLKQWNTHRQIQPELKGETLYATDLQTVGGSSAFFNAASYAFNNHCPWIITPDNIWLTCLLGLSHHIDNSPEEIRQHFVSHPDKIELTFKTGGPPIHQVTPETWERGIENLSDQIQDHIGKKYDLIVCNFSTTRHIDKIASKISLMTAMKHFFDYKMILACGLSHIFLEGTPDDWNNIYDRVRALSEFNLEWWTSKLLPVIEQLIQTSKGNPDLDFWNSMYTNTPYGSGSQGFVSGWINTLFPYINGDGGTKNLVRNNFKKTDEQDFPFSMSMVPVKVDSYSITYNANFYAGLAGVTMDSKTYTVKAETAYCIQNLCKKY